MTPQIYILSERNMSSSVSHQVLFEWEDEIAEAYRLEIVCLEDIKKHYLARLAKKMGMIKPISFNQKKKCYLFLVMNINHLKYTTWYQSNTIPVIFDVEEKEIPDLIRLTKNLPLFFVTSLSLLAEIKKRYPNCKVEYTPQTISSKSIEEGKPISKRSLDVIQYGRKDPLLHKFALRYCNEHPQMSYMYRSDEPNCFDMMKWSRGVQLVAQ